MSHDLRLFLSDGVWLERILHALRGYSLLVCLSLSHNWRERQTDTKCEGGRVRDRQRMRE